MTTFRGAQIFFICSRFNSYANLYFCKDFYTTAQCLLMPFCSFLNIFKIFININHLLGQGWFFGSLILKAGERYAYISPSPYPTSESNLSSMFGLFTQRSSISINILSHSCMINSIYPNNLCTSTDSCPDDIQTGSLYAS